MPFVMLIKQKQNSSKGCTIETSEKKEILNVLQELQNLREKLPLKYTVKFQTVKDGSGYVNLFNNHIILDSNLVFNPELLLQVFFHEYAHIFCKHEKIFAAYHNIFDLRSVTVADYKKYRRVALSAEKYAESVAAVFLKLFYPHITYNFVYNDPEVKKQFRKERIGKYDFNAFKKMLTEVRRGS